MTNNKEFALKLDYFNDHGHDHIGNNRGAESHPFIGYNFRISELNAVGLAQFRRIDEFLNIQKFNYTIIRDALQKLKTFLSERFLLVVLRVIPFKLFLDDIDTAKQVHKSFLSNGIDSCFHYLDNNWHYIRKWDHLKQIKSLYPFSEDLINGLSYLKDKDFQNQIIL